MIIYTALARQNLNRLLSRSLLLLLAVGLLPCGAMAQELPDAGRVLQDNFPASLQPVEPSVDFAPQGELLADTQRGGSAVELKKITLTGNSVYSDGILLTLVDRELGRSFDLAGLRQLSTRISRYYHANGYPFARAYLPQQTMADGVLTIAVLEGRYGTVQATGEGALAAAAQGFVSGLEADSVIEAGRLERAMLILGDQPGINIIPVMRPGAATGSGDLEVQVSKAPRVTGQLSTDNHGNRYSGGYRAQAELQLNRVISFGDEISVQGLYSSEDLWLGQLAYALPLGRSGLRGRVSYAHTAYDLRDPYEGYTGTAKISTADLSYPLIRSRNSNLMAGVSYQYKELDDKLLGASYEQKNSHSWPLGLQFDQRDALAGGGISYGDLSITPGRLNSDNSKATQRAFTKANIRLARIQNLPAAFSLFTCVSGQWADNELDSSESFSLGGANGIRAYPQGEGAGSKGVLGQVELRYAISKVAPYLFYDAGHISRDAEDNRRSIAGAGIGLRYRYANWSLDAVSAWKTAGGDAKSDDKQRDPRIWFSAAYRF